MNRLNTARLHHEDTSLAINRDLARDLAMHLSSPRWPVRAARKERVKVFVLGSRVTRDAMLEGRDLVEIVGHVGRVSLVTALWQRGAPAEAIAKAATSFARDEQRMLLHDMCKTVANALKHSRYDWLILDMVEERFPIMSLGPALLTCSGELRKLELDGNVTGLEAGGEARFALWTAAVEALLEIVPPHKIILNRVFWALQNFDGSTVVSPEVTSRNNAILERMYGYLESRVSHVIDYPDEVRVADPANPWGSSPFHMTPRFYHHTLERFAHIAR